MKYTVGDVEFTREHFSSNPHQVIVTKMSANVSRSLSFTVLLDSKLHHNSRVNGENQIIMEGSCPGKRIPPKAIANANENPKGIQFSAVLELLISDNGAIKIVDGKKLKVEGSDWAVLLLAASSSFDGPFTKPSDSKKDPTSLSLNTLKSVRNVPYSELYARHLDDYQKFFHRVSLRLSKSSKSVCNRERRAFLGSSHVGLQRREELLSSRVTSAEGTNDVVVSTAERVKSFKDDEDPSLVTLMFNYGRYLLISSSRPATQVSNLQGIWSKDIEPAWE